MAREIVDIALVSIDHSGGRYELTTVQEMTVGNPDPKAPVKTMNRRRRAIGYTRGVPGFSVGLPGAAEGGGDPGRGSRGAPPGAPPAGSRLAKLTSAIPPREIELPAGAGKALLVIL